MMEYGVYLESSIVDLKPRVLDFLTKLVEKAKEVKEYAVAFKKKELAEITGKDIRTTARYLKELEDRKVITTKGVRGRSGGTVIMFNADLIRFDTSDRAFINSEEPISIDDIVEQKLPKKKPEDPKKKKRDRRSKQQMIEAKALENKQQSDNDKINDELEKLGGVPNWGWFQSTKDPVGNYKTYLITRLYNRYAALFVDQHNSDISAGLETGSELKFVTNDYDVLPIRFYGSPRWNKFEEVRKFCDDNGVEPSVYLSSQFNRSVFKASNANNDKLKIPFVNGLLSATAYETFLQYVDFQMKSKTYKTYFKIPAKFMGDFVVRTIAEAYETADKCEGLRQYNSAIIDFFEGTGSGAKEEALLNFYRLTARNLREQGVSVKSRKAIKQFILLQSLIQTSGGSGLPEYLILGTEMTQIMLASISKIIENKSEAMRMKEIALGKLIHPTLSLKEQEAKGHKLFYQYSTMFETMQVLRLITERKGLSLTLVDLNEAFREYGKEKIPVDDYSMLDIEQIVSFMQQDQEVEKQEASYKDIVQKREYELKGSIVNDDILENLLSNL